MKLVFTLGNPGTEYEKTRHNVGFMTANMLVAKHSTTFNEKPKLKAHVADFQVDREKVLVAKPTTFYNEVGESLSLIMNFYKIAADNILVVHDELALPFGTLRARTGGSDAGNNGIKSVNQYGGVHTHRLRIGVATQRRTLVGDTDFVLGVFSAKEHEALKQAILPKAAEVIQAFLQDSHIAVSHTVDLG